MVDLLAQHHRHGRRFEPTEFVEEGPRVAVGMNVSDPRWEGKAEVFKVLTFRDPGAEAVLLQDCTGRDDALAYLGGSPPRNPVARAHGAGAGGSARAPRTAV